MTVKRQPGTPWQPYLVPPAVLQDVRVILIGCRKGYSVGGTARVLSSFECLDLVHVQPRCGVRSRQAMSSSAGAQYIVRNARTAASLQEALQGCSVSVAFSRWSAGTGLQVSKDCGLISMCLLTFVCTTTLHPLHCVHDVDACSFALFLHVSCSEVCTGCSTRCVLSVALTSCASCRHRAQIPKCHSTVLAHARAQHPSSAVRHASAATFGCVLCSERPDPHHQWPC